MSKLRAYYLPDHLDQDVRIPAMLLMRLYSLLGGMLVATGLVMLAVGDDPLVTALCMFGFTAVYAAFTESARRGHILIPPLLLLLASMTSSVVVMIMTGGLGAVVCGNLLPITLLTFARKQKLVLWICGLIWASLSGLHIWLRFDPSWGFTTYTYEFRVSLLTFSAVMALAGLMTHLASKVNQASPDEVRESITALEDARANLRESSRRSREAIEKVEMMRHAKGRFLANMSHELRTPLNAIVGYAGLVNEQLADEMEERALSPQHHEDAQHIQQASQELLLLINDILDLSKIEATRMSTRSKRFELGQLIEKTREDVEARPRAGEHALTWSMPEAEGVEISCDLELTAQLFVHTILASAVHGSLHASIERGNGALRLRLQHEPDASEEAHYSRALLHLHELLRDELLTLLGASRRLVESSGYEEIIIPLEA